MSSPTGHESSTLLMLSLMLSLIGSGHMHLHRCSNLFHPAYTNVSTPLYALREVGILLGTPTDMIFSNISISWSCWSAISILSSPHFTPLQCCLTYASTITHQIQFIFDILQLVIPNGTYLKVLQHITTFCLNPHIALWEFTGLHCLSLHHSWVVD